VLLIRGTKSRRKQIEVVVADVGYMYNNKMCWLLYVNNSCLLCRKSCWLLVFIGTYYCWVFAGNESMINLLWKIAAVSELM
jgi:hypothetical protein